MPKGDSYKPFQSGANFWSLQGLTSNQHTLDVTLTAGEFSLDYITYTHSPVASLSGNLNVILDDADSSVQLLGNWTRSPPTIPNGVPYQGTVSGSSTVGDTMKVQFEGVLHDLGFVVTLKTIG